MTPFELYLAANQRLDALIDPQPDHDRTLQAVQARAADRLARMAKFLQYLGNPHRSVPVIHVGGTSGKGSTATAIAAILRAAGYSTLLHTSPYLQVATEKLQINGSLIDPETFASLTDDVIWTAEQFGHSHLTYGEAWMAMIGLAMEQFKPDVAVIEVGAGGRFDLTNVVDSRVAVITTVGIDHTETLGGTIPEIAWHKAGIIKPGSALVHGVEQPEARAEIDRQVRIAAPEAITVVERGSLGIARGADSFATWQDPVSGQRLRPGIPGMPQAQNGALAVAAVRAFDPAVSISQIEDGLENSRIAARFERMPGETHVILDGAHNLQKMTALLPDLVDLPRPLVAVIGFLAAKRSDEMIALLGPSVDHVVVASPNIIGKPGREVTHTAASVRRHVNVPVIEAADSIAAVRMAERVAGERGSAIVTGSLYLCGAAREHWYNSQDIVEQRTQWPEPLLRPKGIPVVA